MAERKKRSKALLQFMEKDDSSACHNDVKWKSHWKRKHCAETWLEFQKFHVFDILHMGDTASNLSSTSSYIG